LARHEICFSSGESSVEDDQDRVKKMTVASAGSNGMSQTEIGHPAPAPAAIAKANPPEGGNLPGAVSAGSLAQAPRSADAAAGLFACFPECLGAYSLHPPIGPILSASSLHEPAATAPPVAPDTQAAPTETPAPPNPSAVPQKSDAPNAAAKESHAAAAAPAKHTPHRTSDQAARHIISLARTANPQDLVKALREEMRSAADIAALQKQFKILKSQDAVKVTVALAATISQIDGKLENGLSEAFRLGVGNFRTSLEMTAGDRSKLDAAVAQVHAHDQDLFMWRAEKLANRLRKEVSDPKLTTEQRADRKYVEQVNKQRAVNLAKILKSPGFTPELFAYALRGLKGGYFGFYDALNALQPKDVPMAAGAFADAMNLTREFPTTEFQTRDALIFIVCGGLRPHRSGPHGEAVGQAIQDIAYGTAVAVNVASFREQVINANESQRAANLTNLLKANVPAPQLAGVLGQLKPAERGLLGEVFKKLPVGDAKIAQALGNAIPLIKNRPGDDARESMRAAFASAFGHKAGAEVTTRIPKFDATIRSSGSFPVS